MEVTGPVPGSRNLYFRVSNFHKLEKSNAGFLKMLFIFGRKKSRGIYPVQ